MTTPFRSIKLPQSSALPEPQPDESRDTRIVPPPSFRERIEAAQRARAAISARGKLIQTQEASDPERPKDK